MQDRLRQQAVRTVPPNELLGRNLAHLAHESLPYRAGFFAALSLYLQLTLERCQVDLKSWPVLAALATRNKAIH